MRLFNDSFKQEAALSVFVAYSDESGDGQGYSYRAGFIAPSRYWEDTFVPAWRTSVLQATPVIHAFHMTDLLSPRWQAVNSLSAEDVQKKIDDGFAVVNAAEMLHPICFRTHGGQVRTLMKSVKVKRSPTSKAYVFDAEYLNFIGFVFTALAHTHHHHPQCGKVDFVAERNGKITQRLEDFHDKVPEALRSLGHPELAPLRGALIPGPKDLSPLQAADMLCWHEQRRDARGWNAREESRFEVIARRRGYRNEFQLHDIEDLASRAAARHSNLSDKSV